MHVWLRPALGLWFGAGQAGGERGGKTGGGSAGLVFGDFVVRFGLLFGLNIGFGEKYGLFTGLVGAIALIPLFSIGFIGIPIGFHFKKRFGIGIVFPIVDVDPILAVIVGVTLFAIGLVLSIKKKEVIIE